MRCLRKTLQRGFATQTKVGGEVFLLVLASQHEKPPFIGSCGLIFVDAIWLCIEIEIFETRGRFEQRASSF